MIKSVETSCLESEDALIGSLLFANKKIEEIGFLEFSDFHSKTNSFLFKILKQRLEDNKSTDPLLLFEEYKAITRDQNEDPSEREARESRVADYVGKMVNDVFSSEAIIEHALHIKDMSFKRQIKGLVNETGRAFDNKPWDSFEVIEKFQAKIDHIKSQSLSRASYTGLSESIPSLIESMINKESETVGIQSEYHGLDEKMGGFRNSEMIVLAARPSIGKSMFAQNIGVNVVKQGVPVLFFSLEMKEQDLGRRMLSSETKIPLSKLERQSLHNPLNDSDYQKQMRVGGDLAGCPWYQVCEPNIGLDEVRTNLNDLNRELTKTGGKKVGLVIIDYIGLMKPPKLPSNRNRENEVSVISKGLKDLAMDMDIPIFVLCQLNREIEKRQDKTPKLSDLRESGTIEQDADVVLMMHRPDAEKFKTGELSPRKASQTIVQVAKNRNGKVGQVELLGFLQRSRFENLQGDHGGTSWD